MPSRSRDKQLAKLASRRQAERAATSRRRRIAGGVVGGLVGLVGIIIGAQILLGGDADPSPGTSATPTPTPTASASPGVGPTQTGTVGLEVEPPSVVACSASRPAAADEPKPQFDRPPQPREVLEKKTTYVAVVHTSCGTLTIELDAKSTPKTVASFVFLAEQGYFDGVPFHRVVDSIDVVQGGDPTGSGSGGPGYTIADELAGEETYTPGTVAMANGGPNTGGSQFFWITGPDGTNLDINPAYTIFGLITDGLDVAKTMNALMPGPGHDGGPTEAIYIETVSIRARPA